MGSVPGGGQALAGRNTGSNMVWRDVLARYGCFPVDRGVTGDYLAVGERAVRPHLAGGACAVLILLAGPRRLPLG